MVVGDDSDFMIKVCLLCKGTIVLMRDDDRSKNNMIHCMNEFERGGEIEHRCEIRTQF